jgi:hypothetical protein
MPESKYKVGDIIQFRSNQPMRHLNKMFSHDADDNVMDVDEYIGVITDVSFFIWMVTLSYTLMMQLPRVLLLRALIAASIACW